MSDRRDDRNTDAVRRPAGLPALLLLSGCLLLAVYHCSPVSARAYAPPPEPASSVQFLNRTKEAGIRFVHIKGNQGTATILEELGPGVCVADFDGDGWQDIYFVNGRDLYKRGIEARNALYRNRGGSSFSDVTAKAGVPGNAYSLGCVWGDYDNDGDPDLYVSQYGKNILYRNNGDGTFADVTEKAGVDGTDFGTIFHTGATFFDYDRDGRLDLYAGGYVDFGPASQRTCLFGAVYTSCPPRAYSGTIAVLYRNNGDGTFANVTKAANMYQPKGKNLSVGAADYDNDGWPDLFVANDGVEAYLYRNNQNGTFTETGLRSGMSLTIDGLEMAAMCLSFGDYNNDGRLDLYISDFQAEPSHIWRNDGRRFTEVTFLAGIAAATEKVLSFGGGFFDFDNDGWLDLFIANGHVYAEVEQASKVSYKQRNSLFRNNGNGKFTEVTGVSGSGFATPYVGRGAAFADFDNDGDLDVIVANNDDSHLLIYNQGGTGNHFLNFKLTGTKSNRDAMGTRIRIGAGTMTQIREISGGGSYLSQHDLRAFFGLGRNTKAESVEVTWPSGLQQVFRDVDADGFYVLEEGKEQLTRQKFR